MTISSVYIFVPVGEIEKFDRLVTVYSSQLEESQNQIYLDQSPEYYKILFMVF